jgi:hypothetical protein
MDRKKISNELFIDLDKILYCEIVSERQLVENNMVKTSHAVYGVSDNGIKFKLFFDDKAEICVKWVLDNWIDTKGFLGMKK